MRATTRQIRSPGPVTLWISSTSGIADQLGERRRLLALGDLQGHEGEHVVAERLEVDDGPVRRRSRRAPAAGRAGPAPCCGRRRAGATARARSGGSARRGRRAAMVHRPRRHYKVLDNVGRSVSKVRSEIGQDVDQTASPSGLVRS